MPEDRYALSNMELDEISLCADGDNDLAKVVLAKTAPDEESTIEKCGADCPVCNKVDSKKKGGAPMTKATLEAMIQHAEIHGEDSLGIYKSAEDNDGGSTIIRKTPGGEEVVPEENKNEPTEEDLLKSLPDDVRKSVQDLLDSRDEEIETLKAAAEDDTWIDEPNTDPVEKVLAKASPEVRTLIEKMQKDTTDALELAKSEQDKRINREMLSKAAEYKNMAGTDQEKADLLKEAYGVSDEFGKKFEQTWKAANAQLDAAADGMFKPIGKSTTGDITVATEVEQKVDELRKADPKLTKEQAEAQVFAADPDLYSRVTKEA